MGFFLIHKILKKESVYRKGSETVQSIFLGVSFLLSLNNVEKLLRIQNEYMKLPAYLRWQNQLHLTKYHTSSHLWDQ